MANRKTSNQQRKRPECHTPDLTITLSWDQDSGWLDENQDLAAFSHNIDRNSSLFIRKDTLDSYLSKVGKSLVFSRFGRKQISQGFANDAKLMEVTSRYVYMPSDCSLKRISEETEYLGFEPREEPE